MSFRLTNTVDITVNGQTYNSLADFGLAISNTDYVGDPGQPDSLIYVPGRSAPLDITETVFGEQYFTSRKINILFGGIEPGEWDQRISEYRNLFEGKRVQLSFASDPGWYYSGRVHITGFKHQRALGTFNFELPEADPFKYAKTLTTYDVLPTYAGKSQVCVNAGRMKVIPNFYSTASNALTFGDIQKNLVVGDNSFDDIEFLPGTNEVILAGTGTVTISYREGKL